MKQDFSLSAILSAFVSTMVGYAGPLLIIFQAAQLAGLTDRELSSWIWAISLGSGVTTFALSYYFRVPIITAWSTPGAVLLVATLADYSYAEAIGAFIVSGLLMTVLGVTGSFAKWMDVIPLSLTSAMLAGVLLKFGLDVFVSFKTAPVLVVAMFVTFIVAKRLIPRYAVIASLLVGIGVTYSQGQFHFDDVTASFVQPLWTTPTFTFEAFIGLALPLAIVTMTSQNATGIGVLRAHGYMTPASPLITATSVTSMLLAPFGAHGINLAAITAAICMGEETHANPTKRYIAGLSAGVIYVMYGFAGATIASFFAAFPRELILIIGGLALFTSISSSLTQAMATERKDSALITFLVTASGVTVFGIGSAFWGLIIGGVAHVVLYRREGLIRSS